MQALRDCGLEVNQPRPDDAYPDATFVEDTAIMTERGAIVMRPGAPSRAGEVHEHAQCLRNFYPQLPAIEAPGTVDGGDICEADGHFLIGVSARTNEDGARSIGASICIGGDIPRSIIDIRDKPGAAALEERHRLFGRRRSG